MASRRSKCSNSLHFVVPSEEELKSSAISYFLKEIPCFSQLDEAVVDYIVNVLHDTLIGMQDSNMRFFDAVASLEESVFPFIISVNYRLDANRFSFTLSQLLYTLIPPPRASPIQSEPKAECRQEAVKSTNSLPASSASKSSSSSGASPSAAAPQQSSSIGLNGNGSIGNGKGGPGRTDSSRSMDNQIMDADVPVIEGLSILQNHLPASWFESADTAVIEYVAAMAKDITSQLLDEHGPNGVEDEACVVASTDELCSSAYPILCETVQAQWSEDDCFSACRCIIVQFAQAMMQLDAETNEATGRDRNESVDAVIEQFRDVLMNDSDLDRRTQSTSSFPLGEDEDECDDPAGLRKRILNKYQVQEIRDTDEKRASSSRRKGASTYGVPQSDKVMVRYRDGQVVTRSGHKFIIEKDEKDEDLKKNTTVRLTVITKGKRGA
eukprot:TRINITY_DN19416_c0_g1::TRINITY_DN19416_c0_g1_i1::g.7848::m.7848 TRINITY_DN19416_c0_g1::TRINITY_DN19416_c0_g1_i1::g.7848  ORF type:complete len:438 (+),score=59.66 TRINITY_DN19416_c0_g1_i1:70-1383(+)